MSEDRQQYEYGTFQGVPQQPAPPPGTTAHPPNYYYAHGYVVAERQRRPLPCCGCGTGWFLFIIGFFLGAIPWYIAAFIMLFSRIEQREKPGYIACTVAVILATIAIIFGATNDDWYDW